MDLTKAYEILELEFKSPINQVKIAYKKLAIKHHPDKTKDDKSIDKMQDINKAYKHILSFDPDKINSSGNPQEKQQPEKKPQENSPKTQNQEKLFNEYDLSLTLEEIFTGRVKYVRITRECVNQNGIVSKEEATIPVTVTQECTENTRITVPGVGDRVHGKIPKNVVFIVQIEPHKIFKISKSKYDLEYVAKVTARQAKLGCRIRIPTLDNAQIALDIKRDTISKNFVRKVPNRGLAYPDTLSKRGSLNVSFEII